MTTQTKQRPYVHIPVTVSSQAQEFLATLKDPALVPEFPDPADLSGWRKLQAWADADGKAKSEPLLKRYAHTATEGKLGGRSDGGCPSNGVEGQRQGARLHARRRPRHVQRGIHAGKGRRGRVFNGPSRHLRRLHARAPRQVQPDVRRGCRGDPGTPEARTAPRKSGDLRQLSGGGLAAAVVLKMRDQGLGMAAAAVLVSAWLDVTPSGDTETTLHDADPNQLYEKHGKHAAAAFADPRDQKDPYASPVYGDFSKGFPPTLIQGGLKETLLSDFVRLYQALDAAGAPVKLDLYEGMIHNFQDRIPDAPKSILARKKMRDFLVQHLRM